MAKVDAQFRCLVTIEDNTGAMTEFVIDDFILRQLLDVPHGTMSDRDVLVSKLLSENNGVLQIKFRGQQVLEADFGSKQQSAMDFAESENEACGSSTRDSVCTDGDCDDGMLEKLFAEAIDQGGKVPAAKEDPTVRDGSERIPKILQKSVAVAMPGQKSDTSKATSSRLVDFAADECGEAQCQPVCPKPVLEHSEHQDVWASLSNLPW